MIEYIIQLHSYYTNRNANYLIIIIYFYHHHCYYHHYYYCYSLGLRAEAVGSRHHLHFRPRDEVPLVRHVLPRSSLQAQLAP